MNQSTKQQGHCYCGSVSFEISGDPVKVAHCHCESCRRSLGAAMVTSAGYFPKQFQLTGKEPQKFETDDGVTRTFCGRCGSSVSYQREKSKYIFIYLGLFDNPENLKPEVHMMYSEKVSWMKIDDDLPKSDEFA